MSLSEGGRDGGEGGRERRTVGTCVGPPVRRSPRGHRHIAPVSVWKTSSVSFQPSFLSQKCPPSLPPSLPYLLHPHQTQHPRQAKRVVTMGVGDKNLVNPRRTDLGTLHLDLREGGREGGRKGGRNGH